MGERVGARRLRRICWVCSRQPIKEGAMGDSDSPSIQGLHTSYVHSCRASSRRGEAAWFYRVEC